RMIEKQPIVTEGLAGLISEGSPIVAWQRIRKRKTGGLEVALNANLLAPFPAQARRIHDCLANRIRGRLARTGQFVVSLSRPVTPLAINPCRQRVQIHRLDKRLLMSFRNSWISVVAE